MKKFSFLILLLCAVILAGCGKSQSTPVVPIAEVDDSEFDLSNIPACVPGLQWQLADATILNMDNLVKNCTQKKDKWRLLDWLGGIFTIYKIFSGQVLFSSPRGDSMPAKDTFCIDENENQWGVTNWLTEISINKNSLDRVISKKLINEIKGDVNIYDNYYCDDTRADADCSSMLDYWWRSDGNNYFIAGFRNGDLVYVINDKLYHPGTTKTSQDGHLMNQSKRNFVWINNNKIIVRRIKDSVAIWDINTEEAYGLWTNVTLETCEISL